MRHVIALFDAPVPARAGLSGLARAGLAPSDIAVLPVLPDALPTASAALRGVSPGDRAAVSGALEALGVPASDAHLFAEAVARGAFLVVARTPTLSAPAAAAALDVAGACSPEALRAYWEVDPGWRLRWAEVSPPLGDDEPATYLETGAPAT